MRRARDEGGAIQVVEAILVAILVGSALLFFALTQRPTLPPGGASSDLAQTAQDVMLILQGDVPGDDANDRLEDFVMAMPLDTAEKIAFRADIAALLPDGMQFKVQLDDGSSLVSLFSSAPAVDDLTPGAGAQSATAYVVTAQLQRVDLVVWDVF